MKKKIIEQPILTILVYVIAYLIGSYLIELSTNDPIANIGLNLIGMLIIGFPFGYLKND